MIKKPIVIIIIISITIVVGYYCYSTPLRNKTVTYSQTQTWKTYQNELYGYSFRYPNNLTIDKSAPLADINEEFFIAEETEIDSYQSRYDARLASFEMTSSQQSFNYATGSEVIKINGVIATKYYLDKTNAYEITLPDNKGTLIIWQHNGITPQSDEVINQILSTLQF